MCVRDSREDGEFVAVATLRVTAEEDGLRLDRWFRRHYPTVPHSRIEKWVRSGQIRIDGDRAKSGSRVRSGQVIRVPPHRSRPGDEQRRVEQRYTEKEFEEIRESVLYEDERIIVINKPAGLAVQGGSGIHHHLDGMLDALRTEGERPRLVHRLDKATSGVMVLAKTVSVAAELAQLFRTRSVRKLYWALVVGVPDRNAGVINLPLRKVATGGVSPDPLEGKAAVTRYRVIEQARGRTAWLALEPLTGRTHQLRAHCATLGTPILGDSRYGGRVAFACGNRSRLDLHLHAREVRLPSASGKTIAVEAPLPRALQETWRRFGFDISFAEHEAQTADAPAFRQRTR